MGNQQWVAGYYRAKLVLENQCWNSNGCISCLFVFCFVVVFSASLAKNVLLGMCVTRFLEATCYLPLIIVCLFSSCSCSPSCGHSFCDSDCCCRGHCCGGPCLYICLEKESTIQPLQPCIREIIAISETLYSEFDSKAPSPWPSSETSSPSSWSTKDKIKTYAMCVFIFTH